MGSTSQKHRNFVLESMGEKPVTEIAGIGPTYGKRLEAQGFDRAYVMLGQFLVLKKSEELFMLWLKEACGASTHHASQCYKCLSDWCNAFLYYSPRKALKTPCQYKMITLGSLCLHAAQLMKHARHSSSDSPLRNYDDGVHFGLINTTENNGIKDQNENCGISLTSVEVRSSVDDDIAHVNIIQIYENKSEEIMEVQYCFPIHPDGGSFVRFKADVDGVPIRDVNKLELPEEDNNSSGLSVGIIEFINWIMSGNKPAIFKVPICSINPGSCVEIRLGYEYKLVNYSVDTLQFFIPRTIVPKIEGKDAKNSDTEYSTAHLAIKVNVLVKGLIDSLESPSHPGILVVGKFEDPIKKGWTQAQVKFNGDSKDMKDDFILLIKKSERNENEFIDSSDQETEDKISPAAAIGVASASQPSLDALEGISYDGSTDSTGNLKSSSQSKHNVRNLPVNAAINNIVHFGGYSGNKFSPSDLILAQQTIETEDPHCLDRGLDYSIMKAIENAYIGNMPPEISNVDKETKEKSQKITYANANEVSIPTTTEVKQSLHPSVGNQDQFVENQIFHDKSIMKAIEKAYKESMCTTLIPEISNVAKETEEKSQKITEQLNYKSLNKSSENSSDFSNLKKECSESDSGPSANVEEMTDTKEPEEKIMLQIVEDSAIASLVTETNANEISIPTTTEVKQSILPSVENQDQFVENFQTFHDKSGVYLESKKSVSNVDDPTSFDIDIEQNTESSIPNIDTDTMPIEPILKESNDNDLKESFTSQLQQQQIIEIEDTDKEAPKSATTTAAKNAPQKKFNFSHPRTTKLQISRANLIAKSSLAALAKKLNDNDEGHQKSRPTTTYRKPSTSTYSTNVTPRPVTTGVNRTASFASTLKKPLRGTVTSGATAAHRSPSVDRKKVTFENANPPKPLVSDKDVSKILINLQSASGSFELSPILTALLSQDLDNVRQIARDNGWADSSVATAMSLAFFTGKLSDQKSSWNSAFDKGNKWLHAHFPKKATQIMEYMNQHIFHE